MHRYDEGEFFPCKDEANFDYIGSGNGEGHNVNVAWNWDSMGDAEYMMALQHLLLPIATEVRVQLGVWWEVHTYIGSTRASSLHSNKKKFYECQLIR